jgi:hypothetical protein
MKKMILLPEDDRALELNKKDEDDEEGEYDEENEEDENEEDEENAPLDEDLRSKPASNPPTPSLKRKLGTAPVSSLILNVPQERREQE